MAGKESELTVRLRQRLKEYLSTNKMTQKELADRLDMTEAAVSRYVTGARVPGIEAVAKIAKVTGISLDALIRDLPEAG